jgi:hypothetical protein
MSVAAMNSQTAAGVAYVIDTTVRVIGANTGFRMDIPVRYLKIE